jgi:hypothetical protein
MRRKSVVPILVITLVIGATVLGSQIFVHHSVTHAQVGALAQRQRQSLPEHVPYMFLFHHLVVLKQKADEIEQRSKVRSSLLTRFQEDARLSAEQFQTLYQIASDCEQQLAEQDKKAMVIINAMKAPYPDGKLPAGQGPPPIPAELISLQQDRDSIILQARDRLRLAFGAPAFLQFHAFVQSRIGSDIKSDIPR